MKNNLFQLILILMLGCANPQPPSGGPPDKKPPHIVSYEPEQESRNFKGNRIRLEFDKYMDKNSVNENIFISPPIEMSYDWSGKELEIIFEKQADSNTTYVLSIGSDYMDLKRNKPKEAFTLIFSTADYLDSCKIRGELLAGDPIGVFIYAYRIDHIDADTLNMGHTKPNYRTQAGVNGSYDLRGLKDGMYRIIAIRDKYKDEVYDAGIDDFGAAPFDVEAYGDSIAAVNLRIGEAEDISGPILFECESLFGNLLSLKFSEPIDTASISKESFELSDSIGTKRIVINGAMISPESANEVWVTTEELLDTNVLWKIACGNTISIRDTNGNIIQDSANYAYFYSIEETDTGVIEIAKIPFPDSSKGVDIIPELEFAFVKPIADRSIENQILIFNNDGLKIDFNIIWKTGNRFLIKPKSKLDPLKWYNLSFELDSLCITNGSCFGDSTLTLSFQTRDTRNYGGAMGRIEGLTEADSSLFIIFKTGSISYETTPMDSGKWYLPDLPEGKYRIFLFYDINGNKKYDYGSAYPFKHSEPFIFIKSEQEIPSRWTIELNLPNPGKR